MKTLIAIANVVIILSLSVACSEETTKPSLKIDDADVGNEKVELLGRWIVDLDADVMLDPQTSGLKYANGYLYSVSDGSADESQTRRLHQISMADSAIRAKFGPASYSEEVMQSCFYNYLANKPDYEALVPVAGEEGVWIFVTEDASRSEPLSDSCQQKYAETGSTIFPSLVVRLQLTKEQLELTHVRPIQFDQTAQVGNFPNDGIEGLAITKDNRLLLGLEKDAFGQARVFELLLTQDFWQTQDFAKVRDSELLLPKFESGDHPINGMDVYYPSDNEQGYLLAAARNHNELWIIDLAKRKPAKRIKLDFRAPSQHTDVKGSDDSSAADNKSAISSCAQTHSMNNTAIEGLAVVKNEVWLVNDPWKENYLKNVVCPSDGERYKRMAPLLFSMQIRDAWFD